MLKTSNRLKFALRWSFGHLLVSGLVALLSAMVVFGLWYPSPWRSMLGITGIFAVVVAADVICGPLLTLVLASPKKSNAERWLDMSLVATIQLIALAFGLWSVFSARPVILGFEVDRFVVVTANEIQIVTLKTAPEGLRQLPFAGVNQIGVRAARSNDELLQSLDASLQGAAPSMWPDWWRPYEDVRPAVVKKAQALGTLIESRPVHRATLINAAAATGLTVAELRFLPLTSSKRSDWVALLNASGSIVGYAPVDGFD